MAIKPQSLFRAIGRGLLALAALFLVGGLLVTPFLLIPCLILGFIGGIQVLVAKKLGEMRLPVAPPRRDPTQPPQWELPPPRSTRPVTTPAPPAAEVDEDWAERQREEAWSRPLETEPDPVTASWEPDEPAAAAWSEPAATAEPAAASWPEPVSWPEPADTAWNEPTSPAWSDPAGTGWSASNDAPGSSGSGEW